MRSNLMPKRTTVIALAALLTLICVVTLRGRSAVRGTSESTVAYPEGYRKWVHVYTVVVGPQSPFFSSAGGIHHVYANSAAMKGYETGKFPDGSMLVFDLLNTQEKDGATTEGPRQRIDVMLKDTRRFSTTGGWGFERFLGDSKTDRPLTEEHRAQCFSCHERRQAHDYVFSAWRN